MAPELFEDDGVYSFSSDIYALGCIAYELTKGSPPFFSDKFQELANKICNEAYEPIEGYSDECVEFLATLLEKVFPPINLTKLESSKKGNLGRHQST